MGKSSKKLGAVSYKYTSHRTSFPSFWGFAHFGRLWKLLWSCQ